MKIIKEKNRKLFLPTEESLTLIKSIVRETACAIICWIFQDQILKWKRQKMTSREIHFIKEKERI